MSSQLAEQDVHEMLSEVARYAQREIAPVAAKHEQPLTPAQLGQLTAAAHTTGLLPADDDETDSIALWCPPHCRTNLQLATKALQEIARVNAGVAWHLHSIAFSHWLLRRLGWTDLHTNGAPVPSLQGHYGLARHALARWLRASQLTEDDRDTLTDYFQPANVSTRLVLHATTGWRLLLGPVFIDDTIQWRALLPAQVHCELHRNGHGLDELPAQTWRAHATPIRRSQLAPDASRALYSDALQITALALIAIALGATEHGTQLATEYASLRSQGGQLIHHHPAVQQLLAGQRGATSTVTALLEQLCGRPLATVRTGAFLQARSEAHPLLCRAANDALQVFGGIGYMQETGAEKILRDVQQLRLMNGTPSELRLFCAEWERLG